MSRHFCAAFFLTQALSLGAGVLLLTGCGGSKMSRLKQLAAARKAAGGMRQQDSQPAADRHVQHPDSPDSSASKSDAAKQGQVKKPTAGNNHRSDDGEGQSQQATGSNSGKIPEKESSPEAGTSGSSVDTFQTFKARLMAKFADKRKSLTPAQKYQDVAAAFAEYVRHHRSFPPKAIPYQKPALSWRVAILPYLGYPELFDQFDPTFPYNSPVNRRLIELMPPEFDTANLPGKTTIVAPVASFSAFWKDIPVRLNRLEDGLSETIAALEVDQEHAVTWSRPKDWQPDPNDLVGGLGNQHGFIVAMFGDGRVDKISSKVSSGDLTAMISYDRGDRFDAKVLSPLEDGDFVSPGNQIPDPSGSPAVDAGSSTRVTMHNDAKHRQPASDISRTPSQSSGKSLGYLQERLNQAATKAIADGDQTAGFELQLAALLLAEDGQEGSGRNWSEFGWSKALRRPLICVRWSIGIMINPEAGKIPTLTRGKGAPQKAIRPGDKELESYTGQIGLDAAVVLRKVIDEGRMGKCLLEYIPWIPRNTIGNPDRQTPTGSQSPADIQSDELVDSQRLPFQNYSGIEVQVGAGRTYHIQVAKKRRTDVLLLIAIDLRRSGHGIQNVTRIYAVDVRSGRELWKSRPLNVQKISADRKNLLKTDLVYETMQDFDRFCRAEIALSDIPETLNHDNVLKRLNVLQNQKSISRVQKLVEARFYLEKNLILLDDYTSFCVQVFGSENEGSRFVTGDPEQRFDILKTDLPGTYLN